MKPRVVVVDYGLCNLDSIRRAIEECGGDPIVTADAADLRRAEGVVLPGVGAFPEAMANLHANGLVHAVNDAVVNRGRPFLGICLGMQLMADTSDEVQTTRGLGWIDATVVRLDGGAGARVPHVGWNEVETTREDPLFVGVPSRTDFYFVHSYAVVPNDERDVLARTAFGDRTFVSAVRRGNRWGVQFHPEKSQRLGFAVLKNFIRAVAG